MLGRLFAITKSHSIILGGLLALSLTLFGAVNVSAVDGSWKDKKTITVNSVDFVDAGVGYLVVPSANNMASNYQVFKPSSGNSVVYFNTNVNLDSAKTASYSTTGKADGSALNLTNTRATAGTSTTPPASGTPGTTEPEKDTCAIDGIGWIVCPLASFMGKVNDSAYAAAEQLLIFNVPNAFDTDAAKNPIYSLWSSLRNFANIAFVIAMFVVIFSQATSVGISAYGIRKMLPRIIFAAVMVNLSYYVCIFGIDISNILGAGLDGLLKIPDQVQTIQNGGWEKVISAILSLQAAWLGVAITGVVAYFATGLFLALAVTAALAVAMTVIILLVRHVLLIVLIILSSLAFVAFILPNTENLFSKWRKTFISLLVMYPLIALLFAGTKLASQVIIVTHQGDAQAGGNIDSFYQLMALAVLTIPLFGIPWIVKFSGGAMARFAGVMNNRSKGLVDRARKFGEEGAKVRRAETKAQFAGSKFGRGLGYERDERTGAIKYDENGNPVKKSGLRGRLGRATGSGIDRSRSAARGDRARNLAERERVAKEALNSSWVSDVNETYDAAVIDPSTGGIVVDANGNPVTMKKSTARARATAQKAAGVGGAEAVRRLQARAASEDNKVDAERVQNEKTLFYNENLDPTTRADNAKSEFIKAVRGNDSVTARAMQEILAKESGSPGVDKLSDAYRTLGDIGQYEVSSSIRTSLLTQGVKPKSAALDSLAAGGGSLEDYEGKASTYTRLSLAETLQQTDKSFGNSVIVTQMQPIEAQAILDNPDVQHLIGDSKKALLKEVVARSGGQNLTADDVTSIYESVKNNQPIGNSSSQLSNIEIQTIPTVMSGSATRAYSTDDIATMSPTQVETFMSNNPTKEDYEKIIYAAQQNPTSQMAKSPIIKSTIEQYEAQYSTDTSSARRAISPQGTPPSSSSSSPSSSPTWVDIGQQAANAQQSSPPRSTSPSAPPKPSRRASSPQGAPGTFDQPSGSSPDYLGRMTPHKADGTPMSHDEADEYHDGLGGN